MSAEILDIIFLNKQANNLKVVRTGKEISISNSVSDTAPDPALLEKVQSYPC